MQLINYTALDELVRELDGLAALGALDEPARRRRDDARYTVCVYTGERDHRAALARARALLADRVAVGVG
ncbi:DUF5133 domain-containing protein [Kitasatospora sp. NPDC094015]|uniref:DUF5133 domain-containing protein n=1 Tax=Kitasatospora sp. NPDC094015 TaxID=3155205 RepID=UPI00332B65DF